MFKTETVYAIRLRPNLDAIISCEIINVPITYAYGLYTKTIYRIGNFGNVDMIDNRVFILPLHYCDFFVLNKT